MTPADVGLPPGDRRRTPGLRREEVAQLAGVSTSWYTWLEQGRDVRPSPSVLDAIARALRLDAGERAHLFHLARIELPLSGGVVHQTLGTLRLHHLQSTPTNHPELRLTVYVPADERTRAALTDLA